MKIPDRPFDFQSLSLSLRVLPEGRRLEGRVTHKLIPVKRPSTEISLDAGQTLNIESCSINAMHATFTHEGKRLTVISPSPLREGREVFLEVTYHTTDRSLFGFHWVEPDESDPERRLGFWTVGETTTNSSWVPLYDAPDDFITSKTEVTVPEHWQVIGNGIAGAVSWDRRAKTRTYRWEMTQPHATYLLSLVGGELDIVQDRWKGVPLLYAVPHGKKSQIKATFRDTPRMMSFFSKCLGVSYPFAKYAQCMIYDYGGGTENITATIMSVESLTDDRAPGTCDALIAHELAHQWFGNLVTCARWTELWLNEGFATYCELLYQEHSRGKVAFDQARREALESYLSVPSEQDHPLVPEAIDNPDALFDTISYQKGALVLHLLRRELGDKVFFRCLNRYLTRYRHRPVETANLIQVISEEASRDLGPFFSQWVYQAGCPQITMRWSYDTESRELLVVLEQVPQVKGKTLPFVIDVSLAALASGRVAPLGRFSVTVRAMRQEYRLPLSQQPTALLFDPNHDLLARYTPEWRPEELPTILQCAPCHLDRVLAAKRLCDKWGAEKVASLLRRQLARENDALVRADLLSLLAPLDDVETRNTLRKYARSDQPALRAIGLRGLGSSAATQDDLALLHAVGGSHKEPYVVVRGALEALAKRPGAQSLATFSRQLDFRTPSGGWESDVLMILCDAGREDALPLILSLHTPKTRRMIRSMIAYCLTKLGISDPKAGAVVLELLQDREESVVSRALEAVRFRRQIEALPILEERLKTTPYEHMKAEMQSTIDFLKKKYIN